MRPHYLERKKKRNSNKIKEDVVRTKKLLRDDIRDVLMLFKDRESAEKGLRLWLQDLNSDAVLYQGSKEKGIDRIVSDIDSYGVFK